MKVFGSDLNVLDRLGRAVADALRAVPGASSVYPEPLTSGQYLNIAVDREAAARYGLSVAAIEDTIAYAIGETPAGTAIEGRERFPIRAKGCGEARVEAREVENSCRRW